MYNNKLPEEFALIVFFILVLYLRIWDGIAILTCVVYYIFSFLTASSAVSKYHLTITNASVVCVDQVNIKKLKYWTITKNILSILQVRLLMKLHSFWRYNCEKVLRYKSHSDQEIKLPTLSKFIYFLFAPTLLYRNNYPRYIQLFEIKHYI